MRTTLFFVILAAAMISCGERQGTAPDPEVEGQQWLSKARTALSDPDLVKARAAIDSLRSQCAEALNAREEGILLFDSIELAEARRQLTEAEKAASQQGLDIYTRKKSWSTTSQGFASTSNNQGVARNKKVSEPHTTPKQKRYLAESNCCTRFCRPLPSHSAKVPKIKKRVQN